jgi:hypothetical protein
MHNTKLAAEHMIPSLADEYIIPKSEDQHKIFKSEDEGIVPKVMAKNIKRITSS